MGLLRNIQSLKLVLRNSTRNFSILPQFKVRFPNQTTYNPLVSHSNLISRGIQIQRCYNTTILKEANANSMPITDYLNHEYSKIRGLLSDNQQRTKYLTHLRAASSFTPEEIQEILQDYQRLVDVLHHECGWDFFREFWHAIFYNGTKSDPSISELRITILESRSALCKLLLRKADYKTYWECIEPLVEQYSSPTLLDSCIQLLQLQADSNGKIQINREEIEQFLEDEENSLELKKDYLIILASTVLKFVAEDMEQKLKYIDTFFELRNMFENNDWIFDPSIDQTYDKVLRIIGKPPSQVEFSTYATKLLEVIKGRYLDDMESITIITRIMGAMSESDPIICMKYFKFKLCLIDEQNLPSNTILSSDDLLYAMIANIHEPRRSYELYIRFPELQSPDHVTILLRISLASNNWFSLQERFAKYYGRQFVVFPTEADKISPAKYGAGELSNENMDHSSNVGITMKGYSNSWLPGGYRRIRKMERYSAANRITRTSLMCSAIIWGLIKRGSNSRALRTYDRYIKSVSFGKSDPSGSEKLLSMFLPLFMQPSDIQNLVTILAHYLRFEQRYNLYLVQPKDIKSCLEFVSKNFSLSSVKKIHELVQQYNKFSPEAYSGLIEAYTYLGQYEVADKTVYQAHKISRIPLSDPGIFVSQLRNHQAWLKRTNDESIVAYNKKMIALLLDLLIQPSIIEKLDDYRDFIPHLIKLNLEYGNEELATTIFESARKRFILTEDDYYPLLEYYVDQNRDCEKFEELLIMMREENITQTARTYSLAVRASRITGYPDVKVIRMLSVYGVTDSGLPYAVLNFKRDAYHICQAVIDFLAYRKIRDITVLNMVVTKMKREFNGTIPFEIRSIIHEFMKYHFKRQPDKLNQLNEIMYKDYRTLTYRFISEYPFEGKRIMVPTLQEQFGNILVSELRTSMKKREEMIGKDNPEKASKGIVGPDRARNVEYAIESAISEQVIGGSTNLNLIILKLLEAPNFEYLTNALDICEKHMIKGSWRFIKEYEAKKLCFKMCICHLGDEYSAEEIESKFKMFLDFYEIESIAQARQDLDTLDPKPKNFNNFMRSSSGRLFDLDDAPVYPYATMNSSQFVEYFHPEQFYKSFETWINPHTTRRLYEEVTRYCNTNAHMWDNFRERFPDTVNYIIKYNSLGTRLSDFRGNFKNITGLHYGGTLDKRIYTTIKEFKRLFEGRQFTIGVDTPPVPKSNIEKDQRMKLKEFKEEFNKINKRLNSIGQDYSQVKTFSDLNLLRFRSRLGRLIRQVDRLEHRIFKSLGLKQQGPYHKIDRSVKFYSRLYPSTQRSRAIEMTRARATTRKKGYYRNHHSVDIKKPTKPDSDETQ